MRCVSGDKTVSQSQYSCVHARPLSERAYLVVPRRQCKKGYGSEMRVYISAADFYSVVLSHFEFHFISSYFISGVYRAVTSNQRPGPRSFDCTETRKHERPISFAVGSLRARESFSFFFCVCVCRCVARVGRAEDFSLRGIRSIYISS